MCRVNNYSLSPEDHNVFFYVVDTHFVKINCQLNVIKRHWNYFYKFFRDNYPMYRAV